MKISVVIPVFNSETTICRCINSILNQTYKNWEIIAINDGSKDSSYKILKEYEALDERIRIFNQDNMGPGHSRNQGITRSTGDYIVFLDSDDYVENRYLEEIEKSVKMKNADVIFIDVVQEKPNGSVVKYEKMSKYKYEEKETIIRHQMTGKLPWGGCRKVVKKSLLIENNILYSDDDVGEEALFSFNVLKNSEKIDFIEKTYYHYINYQNSQSKKGDNNPWGNVCKNMKDYLEKQGLTNKYKKSINSFAFTSFIVSVYRTSQNNNFNDAIKLSKKFANDFNRDYSFDMDIDSLEKRVLYMIPLAKLKMISLIVLASKTMILYKKVRGE